MLSSNPTSITKNKNNQQKKKIRYECIRTIEGKEHDEDERSKSVCMCMQYHQHNLLIMRNLHQITLEPSLHTFF